MWSTLSLIFISCHNPIIFNKYPAEPRTYLLHYMLIISILHTVFYWVCRHWWDNYWRLLISIGSLPWNPNQVSLAPVNSVNYNRYEKWVRTKSKKYWKRSCLDIDTDTVNKHLTKRKSALVLGANNLTFDYVYNIII